jgi:hypothetical protein
MMLELGDMSWCVLYCCYVLLKYSTRVPAIAPFFHSFMLPTEISVL